MELICSSEVLEYHLVTVSLLFIKRDILTCIEYILVTIYNIYIYICIHDLCRSSASVDIRPNFDIPIRVRNLSCGYHADIVNITKKYFSDDLLRY